MKRIIVILLLLALFTFERFFIFAPTTGQAQTDAGASGIVALAETLKELTNPYGLACVATRLEDVDFATLDYCHHKLGARVSIILATRNEDQDRPAGLSTQEYAVLQTEKALRAAREIGADVYFLNLRDFGHQSSAETALRLWGNAEATRKMVQAIRRLQPDVIISRHDGKGGDGQQQAVGRLLIEAFDAAADEKAVAAAASETWQAKRFFLKTDANQAEVIVNLGQFDAIRGKTYAAAAALAAATPPLDEPSPPREFYKLALSSSGERLRIGASFFDGFTLPEKLRLSLAQPIIAGLPVSDALMLPEKLVEGLIEKLVEKRAEGSIQTLRQRYGKEFFRVVRYTENLERAMALVLGLGCELRLPDTLVAQGEAVNGQLTFHNNSSNSYPLVFHTPDALAAPGKTLAYETSAVQNAAPYGKALLEISYATDGETAVTWPQSSHLYDEYFYPASALRLSTRASGYMLLAYAEVNLGRVTLTLPCAQRFDVVEDFEISATPGFAYVKDWAVPRDVELTVTVRNRTRSAFTGALWVVPLALQSERYEPLRLTFSREDEEARVKLKLRLPIMKPPLSPDILLEFRREKPAAPKALASLKIPVNLMDCQTPENLKVGYIAGNDSLIPLALSVLGVEDQALPVDEIGVSRHGQDDGEPLNQVCANLSRFDVILVDALVYSGDAKLLAKNRCLLDYARRGGNLIVLQQKPGFWSSVFNQNGFAPYAIRLANEKITPEPGALKLLDANHPLLKRPNQLTANDVEAWAKMEVLYPAKGWAGDYQALLELTNADQESPRGVLLFSRYEEGSYVFSSLNFSAQLGEANPGAYRLLANLLALSKSLKEPAGK